jgi:hypothetical protein
VDTLQVMAEATRKRGYQYFGVADHSQSAHYAGGLSLDEVKQQHCDIDRLNRSYGKEFRILKGIESDILADPHRCISKGCTRLRAAKASRLITAVTIAPTSTSPHSRFRSGKTL